MRITPSCALPLDDLTLDTAWSCTAPRCIFFSPQKPQLADTVRQELELALAGIAQPPVPATPRRRLRRARLDQRRIIELDNRCCHRTPLQQRELWYHPNWPARCLSGRCDCTRRSGGTARPAATPAPDQASPGCSWLLSLNPCPPQPCTSRYVPSTRRSAHRTDRRRAYIQPLPPGPGRPTSGRIVRRPVAVRHKPPASGWSKLATRGSAPACGQTDAARWRYYDRSATRWMAASRSSGYPPPRPCPVSTMPLVARQQHAGVIRWVRSCNWVVHGPAEAIAPVGWPLAKARQAGTAITDRLTSAAGPAR